MAALRHRRMTMVVAALAALVVGFLVLVVYDTAHTTSVTVLNDGPQMTRLSWCQIDDALDLDPGETAPLDVDSHGRTGCNVFVFGHYEGCLIVDTRTAGPRQPIRMHDSVDSSVTQSRCEAIG